jgi:hypothetical protein
VSPVFICSGCFVNDALAGIEWIALANLCNVTTVPRSWPVLWGAPVSCMFPHEDCKVTMHQIFFEIVILTFVIFNSIATPRSVRVPLRRSLQNNGISFFLTMLVLRTANLIIAAVARSTLVSVVLLYVWVY